MHRFLRSCAVVLAASLAAVGCSSSDSESEDETRSVTHVRGTTEVPREPERVVVLDTGELDAALSLGFTPVGVPDVLPGQGVPDYAAEHINDVPIIGTPTALNLEAIAETQPDLILGTERRAADLYDELSQIAPTVFAEDLGGAWEDAFRVYADALGQQSRGEEILASYKERAKNIGAEVGDPSQITVSVVRFTAGDIRLYAKNSFIGKILTDVGLDRPQSQQADKTHNAVSPEQINTADGDLLIYATFGPEQETDRAAVLAGPLWNNLSAVRNGQVHEVPDDTWFLGIGPMAAGKVLDDLEGYLGNLNSSGTPSS